MLQILYQDDHYVAIQKPSGLLVHRTHIAEEKKEFALQKLRNQIHQRVYPVHRLDRPTSGVLIFGLNKEAAAELANEFRNHQLAKTYYAVSRGFAPEKGKIDRPLKKEESGLMQEAVTEYEKLAQIELPIPVGKYETARYSLLKVIPQTGRMHQIRRHLAGINHPIVGDVKHGDRFHNRMFKAKFGLTELLLTAYEINFTHPFTKTETTIKGNFSEQKLNILKQFNWR